MTDDEVDRPEPSFGEVVTTLLREARSLSRRADKLGGTAAVLDDPTTQQLVAEACTSMEQMVHHLMVRERPCWSGYRLQPYRLAGSSDQRGCRQLRAPAPRDLR